MACHYKRYSLPSTLLSSCSPLSERTLTSLGIAILSFDVVMARLNVKTIYYHGRRSQRRPQARPGTVSGWALQRLWRSGECCPLQRPTTPRLNIAPTRRRNGRHASVHQSADVRWWAIKIHTASIRDIEGRLD